MAQFVIRWNDAEQRFEPATLGLRLVMKDKGVEKAIKVVSTKLEPPNIIKLEKDDARCSETRIAWTAKLEDEVIKAKNFYERVMEPVKLTVEIQPVEPPAQGQKVESYTQTSTIKVKVPPATIHWRDLDEPAGGIEDQDPLEVEADNEDELNLEVYLERWNVDVGSMWEDDTVEFSHWTGPTLKPDYFAAHPDDVPDKVADPESGNRRQHSRWKSMCELPSEEYPDAVLPIIGHIRVRAWPNKDIASRSPGAIHFTGDAKGLLAEQNVPLNIVPVRLTAKLIEPTEPIPADGVEQEIKIDIRRTKNDKPPKKAQISWELAKGPERPGGTVDKDSGTLVEADGGHLRITYTPPELWYRPGKKYEEELTVYNGVGATRTEIGRFTFSVNPALDATITMQKLGLECEEDGAAAYEAGETPAELWGNLTCTAETIFPSAKLRHGVNLARVKVIYGGGDEPPTEEIELPEQTNEQGKFRLRFPELEKQWEGQPESVRVQEMYEEDLPVIVLDDDAEQKITGCESQLESKAPHDWYTNYDGELDRRLMTYRLPFTGFVCQRHPQDLARTMGSADLIRIGGTWGTLSSQMYTRSLERGCDEFCSILKDLVDILLDFLEVGEKIARGLAGIVATLGTRLSHMVTRFATSIGHKLADVMGALAGQFRGLVSALEGPVRRLADQALDTMARSKAMIDEVLEGFSSGASDAGDVLGAMVKSIADSLLYAGQLMFAMVGNGLIRMAKAAAPWCESMIDAVGIRATDSFRWAMQDFVREVERAWGTHWGAGTYGDNYLGKVAETLLGKLIELLSDVTGGASGPLAQVLGWFANPIKWSVPPAVSAVEADVAAYRIPADASASIDQLRQNTTDFAHLLNAQELEAIETDFWMEMLDLVVMLVEFLLFAIGAFTGVGILAAAQLGPILTKVEITINALKIAFVRVPALIVSVMTTINLCVVANTNIRRLTAGAAP